MSIHPAGPSVGSLEKSHPLPSKNRIPNGDEVPPAGRVVYRDIRWMVDYLNIPMRGPLFAIRALKEKP